MLLKGKKKKDIFVKSIHPPLIRSESEKYLWIYSPHPLPRTTSGLRVSIYTVNLRETRRRTAKTRLLSWLRGRCTPGNWKTWRIPVFLPSRLRERLANASRSGVRSGPPASGRTDDWKTICCSIIGKLLYKIGTWQPAGTFPSLSRSVSHTVAVVGRRTEREKTVR